MNPMSLQILKPTSLSFCDEGGFVTFDILLHMLIKDFELLSNKFFRKKQTMKKKIKQTNKQTMKNI